VPGKHVQKSMARKNHCSGKLLLSIESESELKTKERIAVTVNRANGKSHLLARDFTVSFVDFK
jgi:hypothetical protein